MRKSLPTLFFSFLILSVNAQQLKLNPNNFQISFGKSFHGTGDLRGVSFTVEYGHYFKKRLEIAGTVTTTIHHGESYLFVSAPWGDFDGSVRYVTAGLQANPKIGYSFIRTGHHEFRIQAGGVFRYQSSSLPDGHSVYFPAGTGFPEPVHTFRQFEKQNIFTAGYSADLSYSFTTGKNLFLGVKAGFQNDTNADVISSVGVVIGKRFPGKK